MNSILELIRKTVVSDPSRTAYRSGNDSVSYSSLWNRAETGAEYLKRQGTSPVIVYGDKEISVVVSIISCLMADRTYVPVSTNTPETRARRIIEATGSDLILTDHNADIFGTDYCRVSDLERFSDNAENKCDTDIAYIIFTSGSTGEPKGVPVSVDNLENFVRWISSLHPLCDYRNRIVFNQASFSFDLSVADLYYSLCNGHTLTAAPGDLRERPEAALGALACTNVAVMTPTFARFCLLYKEFSAESCHGLQCIYFCGETLDVITVRRLFRAFPELSIINAYGPTEATSAVTAVGITPEMADSTDILPVGIVDESAVSVSVEDGEIVLRGRSVFGGYQDGLSGGWFSENGVNGYRTGDLGEIRNGLLYCCGRKDRQIKYQGYRIELDDIERNLSIIEGIKDSAVVAKRNGDGTIKLIKAFVVTDGTPDSAAIRKKLQELIPGYMIPKTISFIDALPVNANGKTDRKELEKW
ncbi:MAG: AMP-binding protein [Clostridia bacterium]|nr:AMP-binding protein [Clostridia bacterium]